MGPCSWLREGAQCCPLVVEMGTGGLTLMIKRGACIWGIFQWKEERYCQTCEQDMTMTV